MRAKPKTYEVSGNLIRLSDLFRRAATFDQPELAAKMVKLTRDLGCASTYIYGEYSFDNGVNRQAAQLIGEVLQELADTASAAGIKSITLPFHKASISGELISQRVLKTLNTDVRFTIPSKDYCEDNSAAGLIHDDIKTILDEGIRGVAAIDQDLRWKWAREDRYDPQMKLDF